MILAGAVPLEYSEQIWKEKTGLRELETANTSNSFKEFWPKGIPRNKKSIRNRFADKK